jgi:hypothetical protein
MRGQKNIERCAGVGSWTNPERAKTSLTANVQSRGVALLATWARCGVVE